MQASHCIASGILVAGLMLAPQAEAGDRDWGYRGEEGKIAPADWPGECQPGQRQSPIDISPPETVSEPVEAIAFDYRTRVSTLLDNGYQIKVEDLAGSVRVGGVGGDDYTLDEFHFHTPSEHTVGNLGTAAEVHFVHSVIAKPPDNQRLVVLGALIEPASSLHPSNPGLSAYLAPLCPHLLPATTEALNPSGILPARGYYQYSGSLTTPKCAETVTWFVAKEPLYLSPCLLDGLRAAYPDNARPGQPRNKRKVRSREP